MISLHHCRLPKADGSCFNAVSSIIDYGAANGKSGGRLLFPLGLHVSGRQFRMGGFRRRLRGLGLLGEVR